MSSSPLPGLAHDLPAGTVSQALFTFMTVTFFSFYFEMIIESQGVSKIVQRGPMYPLPSSPPYLSEFSRKTEPTGHIIDVEKDSLQRLSLCDYGCW